MKNACQKVGSSKSSVKKVVTLTPDQPDRQLRPVLVLVPTADTARNEGGPYFRTVHKLPYEIGMRIGSIISTTVAQKLEWVGSTLWSATVHKCVVTG